jgi:hypothetical protein
MLNKISSFILGDPVDRLFHALSTGKTDELYKFLRSGGDPNTSRGGYGPGKDVKMTLIMQMAGRAREVELLLEHGADPQGSENTRTGTSLLHDFADSTDEGNAKVIRKALELGMHPDGSMKAASTPLYIAASRGNMAVVSVLLEFGADPNIKNSGGVSPLEVIGEFQDGMRCATKTKR